MCLVLVVWRAHPRYSCIVAANRDEFHARPAAPAAWWPDPPQVLAGRDLEAGGTWLGLTRTGRWKDPESADRYNHTIASPEARRADLMPVAKKPGNGRGMAVTNKKRA